MRSTPSIALWSLRFVLREVIFGKSWVQIYVLVRIYHGIASRAHERAVDERDVVDGLVKVLEMGGRYILHHLSLSQ